MVETARIDEEPSNEPLVAVLDLSSAPGEGQSWDRPKAIVYLWSICELLFVTNSWQVSSRLRIAVLRAFGAKIGQGVIFRPRSKVRFPWKLSIGDRSWVGEGVWFHNQNHIYIGSDVVLSQETFLTTGSHAHKHDMALITRPIYIQDGAWVTSRCIVLGGSDVGRSAIVKPGTVISGQVPAGRIWGLKEDPTDLGPRFI